MGTCFSGECAAGQQTSQSRVTILLDAGPPAALAGSWRVVEDGKEVAPQGPEYCAVRTGRAADRPINRKERKDDVT